MKALKSLASDQAAPTAIIAIMSVVATLGFRGVFPDWSFVIAAVLGALGAALVSLAGRWARLTVPEAMAVSVVVFVLLGAVAAEGIPTPAAFGTFFSGLTEGWAQVLSSSPPADLTAEFRVLPYTIAWLGSMLGSEILRSSRTPGLAALGPVTALVISLLVVLEDRTVAIAQGGAMVVGALLVGWLQQRVRTNQSEYFEDFTIESPRRSAGVASALLMVVLIAVAAPLVGPRLPLADANERFDLRQFQTPPFDPLEQPSPLVQLKVGLLEANQDEVVFRVTADDPIDRFTLAVLDDYTETFWAVADERGDAPGEFRPVDSVFPPPLDAPLDELPRVTATIEIDGLSELAGGDFDPAWLITPGWPLSVSNAGAENLDIRFNGSTGTIALVPDGPEAGLRYEVIAALPPRPDEAVLRSATVTPIEIVDLRPAALDYTADVVQGADLGWQRVQRIVEALQSESYAIEQGDPYARPGHNVARLEDFVRDGPDRIAGFEEQYAALAALMVRNQGIPARVVVGYLIDEDLEERWATGTLAVLAGDASAWIEVRFDDIGWVPFDVTPDRNNTLDEVQQGSSPQEFAFPNPPPPPPPPELPPRLEQEEEFEEEEDEEDDEAEEGDGGEGLPIRAIATGVGVTSPIWLLLGGSAFVVVLKRRRTRRRREAGTPARQIAGAWFEVVDRAHEHGAAPKRAATIREYANGLVAAELIAPEEGPVLVALADDVDAAAFSPFEAPQVASEAAWQKSEVLVAGLAQRHGTVRRVRHRIDPRPLLRKDPLLAHDDPGEVDD